MSKKLPYKEWLKKQKDRGDPIGDLASDTDFSNKIEHFSDLEKLVKNSDACEAFKESVDKYGRYSGKEKETSTYLSELKEEN